MFNAANNEHIENKRVGTLNALFFKERDDVDEQGRKPHLMDTGEIKQSYFDIPNMIRAARSTWIETPLSLGYNLLFVIFYDKK